MGEYIEREAAVDALNKALFAYEDETEARFKYDPELDISEWFFHRIFVQNMNGIDRKTILDIPAADVQHVLTCSSCRYYHVPTSKCLHINGLAERVFPSDYCSYGAKMEVQDDD